MLTTAGLGHKRILGDTQVIGAVLDFLRGGEVGERVVSTTERPGAAAASAAATAHNCSGTSGWRSAQFRE